MQQQIGRLMVQANFGRTPLSPPALLMANHYRLMVALLTGGLLLSHLLVVRDPLAIVIALAIYAAYATLRLRMPARMEKRFYTPRIQFWRAQAGIAGVTLLLVFLAWRGNAGSLWVLYLSALLLVSRYCEQQYLYTLVALQVAALAAGVHLIELLSGDAVPTTARIIGELNVRVFAVLLPSFLAHYLARVDITAKHGAAVRDHVIQLLLEQAVFETDSAALWSAIREACGVAVKAVESRIYLYNAEDKRLMLHDDAPDADPAATAVTEQLAARAAQERAVVDEAHGLLTHLAAPVFGQPGGEGPPLAVVVLCLQAESAYERSAARQFLTSLLDHIWPICAYASMRQQVPLLDQIDNRDVYRLRLDEVLDVVLDTLCHKLGFSFATVSLVNEDSREIGTVRGKNVPGGWIAESHHPLDSHDIQAHVLRTGRTEVIGEWDPRFDAQIWERYNHAQLVRVWVPLGRVGTIETGFYKHEKSDVPRLLIEIVKRYARDVTIAIQNAQHYEREQHHAALMARLHEVSYDLQTDPHQRDEASLLQHITDSAQNLFDASIVLLYPFDRRSERFTQPIAAGPIEGRRPLAEPNEHANIVRYIADTCAAYYQPDAQCDAKLIAADQVGHGHRTFTARQGILSFAGVPLLARGRLLGVLCVNYRERRQFSPYDRQAIELFAQQGAAVIAGGELVREQERRRLEYDLHDSVKSSVRGLILFSRAATDTLESDPCRARRHLHEMRRAAWGILADVDMILNDLAPNEHEDQVLQRFIRAELRRLVGWNNSKLVLDLDERLPALPMTLTQTMLALMREAIVNAIEHAQAETIRVSLHSTGERVHFMISDDGCGFMPNSVFGEEHRGLAIMHERIRVIGGSLEIISSAGKGTTVWGDLPQKEAAHGT
jgi:signal transduction histidine kinase